MYRFIHYLSMRPKRFFIAICLGYYLIGLAMLFTVTRDDQMEAAMRERIAELPESAPELLIAGFFVYVILPLLWPGSVMSLLFI